MSKIVNRIVSAVRVLFVPNVMLIEISSANNLQQITLWGTVENPGDQITILRALADSIAQEVDSTIFEPEKN